MAKILLLGGGNVLSLLAQKLHQDPAYQQQFVITSRREEQVTNFKNSGYLSAKLNVLDPIGLKNFFQEYPCLEIIVDSVPPIFSSANATWSDSLEGVRNLASCLHSHPLKRLIYLSTTGVYGALEGEVVTEGSALQPLSERGIARMKTEEIYQKLNLEVCCLRIAGISSFTNNPKESLLRGSYPLVDHGERYSNRVHIEDLVEVIFQSLNLKLKLPTAINVSDGLPLKTKFVIAELQKSIHFNYPTSITYQEAEERGWHTLLSNQQVSNQLLIKTFGNIIKYSGIDWIIP